MTGKSVLTLTSLTSLTSLQRHETKPSSDTVWSRFRTDSWTSWLPPVCWAQAMAGNYFLGSLSASLTILGGRVLPVFIFQPLGNPPFTWGLPPLCPGSSPMCKILSLLGNWTYKVITRTVAWHEFCVLAALATLAEEQDQGIGSFF